MQTENNTSEVQNERKPFTMMDLKAAKAQLEAQNMPFREWAASFSALMARDKHPITGEQLDVE
jgi:hypothetical protein